MDTKRRIALSASIIAVALGAGHLVQSRAANAPKQASASVVPTGIVQLSAKAETKIAPEPTPVVVATATPRTVAPAAPAKPVEAAKLPAPMPAPAAPAVATAPSQPEPAPLTATAPAAPLLAKADPVPPPLPVKAGPAPTPVPPATAKAEPAPAAAVQAKADPAPVPVAPTPTADACTVSLSATALPGAVLSLALVAPCDGDARIVLRHAGLAVTGKLSPAGTLFTTIPALDAKGEVSALFADGNTAKAAAAIDMTDVRRFAVQWQGDDAFQLQVYENGAVYGAPGHVSAATPVGEGKLTELGDATVERPMLAQVYTWPAPGTPVEVTLEAAVTDKTCNREILGEVLEADAAKVGTTEITLAMPDCGGVGDFLVLNNLAGQTTLAAAD